MIEQHVPGVEFRAPAINERFDEPPNPVCAAEEESAGGYFEGTASGPCIMQLRKGEKPHRGDHQDSTGHRWPQ